MIIKVYAVFDIKSGVHSTPFFQLNDKVAVRSFTDLVNDKRCPQYAHPGDYRLRLLGEFDDNSGVLKNTHATEIVNGSSVKEVEDPNQLNFDDALGKLTSLTDSLAKKALSVPLAPVQPIPNGAKSFLEKMGLK